MPRAREGLIRLTASAAGEGIAQPSLTAPVRWLEAQGLARRVVHFKDGRARLVATTDARRELMADRRRAQCARVTDLLATLPEQGVQALLAAMRTAVLTVQRMVRAAPQPGVSGGGSAP
jgi:DNA-binding MarR family transcriptional regulator